MIRGPLLTIVVALLLAAGAIAAVARLRIDTSITSLFDEGDPAARSLDHVMNDFRAVEEVLMLVEDPHADAQSPAKLKEFASRLNAAITRDGDCASLCD